MLFRSRGAGADIVILLTGSTVPNTAKLLTNGVVDIILKGDSKEDSVIKIGNGLYGKQGSGAGNALVISAKLSERENDLMFKSEVVPLSNFKPDEKIAGKIEIYLSELSSIIDVNIGTTVTRLDTTYESVRSSENAFGNLVADAIRDYYSADIGFVNGGAIRGNHIYEPGTMLTIRDILDRKSVV